MKGSEMVRRIREKQGAPVPKMESRQMGMTSGSQGW